MTYNTMFPTRWTHEEFESMKNAANNPDIPYKTVTECIREFAKLGRDMWIYKTMLKDPEKAKEFQERVNQMLETNNREQWVQTLSEQEISNIKYLLSQEQTARYEKKGLV